MADQPVAQAQGDGRLLSQVGQLVRTESAGRDVALGPHGSTPAERRTDTVDATAIGIETDRWMTTIPHTRSSWRSIRLSFFLVVIVPMLAVAGYTLFWATPRYVSEFRVAVRSAEPTKGVGGIGELFGLGAFSQTGNDANAVVQYLHSRNAVEAIEQRYPLQASFMSENVDFISRFHGKPDIEALTRHWNRLVDSFYEISTATVVVRVATFAPADALKIANYLLEDAEALVNRMSARAREDSVAFARAEVDKAEARLISIGKRYQDLQEKEAMFDPMKAADANIKVASHLKEQIAQRSADLATSRLRLAPDAPSVGALERVIAGLKRELANVEKQATGSTGTAKDGDRPISHAMGSFQQLIDERTFAEKAHLSALTSLEEARAEANRQQVYLAVIVPPGLPEEADFPRPWRQTGLTGLVAIVVWLIGLMVVYSVREHM